MTAACIGRSYIRLEGLSTYYVALFYVDMLKWSTKEKLDISNNIKGSIKKKPQN